MAVMDLRHLRLFCEIVDQRSFSLAAEYMHITQPAASLRVRSLERELGVQLLDRSGRDVTPTDAGEVLYRHARQIIDLDDEARVEIMNLGELAGGRVTIGASTGPGEHLLPGLITEFKRAHPGIDLSLRVTDSREVIDLVLGRELELGVVGAVSGHSELAVAPFARDEIVVVCAPTHRWAGAGEVAFDELLSEPVVLQQPGAGVRAVVDAALRERGVNPAQLNVFLELGLNESVKHAVMAGAGVTYLSKFAVRTDLRNGTLAVVRVTDFQILRDFSIVRSRTRAVSKAMAAFLHFLEAQYDLL
jgi:DNA-binding transcriptional LysR family regulator